MNERWVFLLFGLSLLLVLVWSQLMTHTSVEVATTVLVLGALVIPVVTYIEFQRVLKEWEKRDLP